jgi:hypothetical protein
MTINDRLDVVSDPLSDVVPDVVSDADRVEPGAPAVVEPSGRVIPWMRILAWLGVLLPLALLTKQAIVSPPSFDGSMNLQVAQNLSQGQGFIRQYVTGQGGIVNHAAGTTLFPQEIQTSGAYTFLAAGLIWIFGSSTFVFELPNLLFMLLLLVATSFSLRRWPVLRIVGPSIVVFAVPKMTENAMGGYGEYVVAALVITSLVLLGSIASGGRRPLLMLAGAGVLLGLAVTVKTVALFAVVPFIIGLVGLALARRGSERPAFNRWWLIPIPLLGVAAPFVAVEVQRLVSLGSFSAFNGYWNRQYDAAGAQAGVSGTGQGSTATDVTHGLHKIADHFHLLSQDTGINSTVLLIAIVTPFLVLVGLFLYRGMAWRQWLAKPGALLAIMLGTYAGEYLVWWLAITPTAKAWMRRIIIALVVLVLFALVVTGMAKDHWQERASLSTKRSSNRTLIARVVWGLVAVLGIVTVIPAITTFQSEAALTYDTNGKLRDQIIALADEAKKLSAEGNTLYAGQFLSAPQAGLYGDLYMRNLGTLDGIPTKPNVPAYCNPVSGIPNGKAYYVWDYYNMHLADASRLVPYSLYYDFTPIKAGSSSYGLIYKIALKSTLSGKYVCPAKF